MAGEYTLGKCTATAAAVPMRCLTEIQPEALVVPTAHELRMLFTAQKEASWGTTMGMQDVYCFPMFSLVGCC